MYPEPTLVSGPDPSLYLSLLCRLGCRLQNGKMELAPRSTGKKALTAEQAGF